MYRRGVLIGLITMALCFAGSPALALAWCPLLHQPAPKHSCCPVHRRAPAPVAPCSVHCASIAAPALACRSVETIVLSAAVLSNAGAVPVLHARGSIEASAVVFDSGGIWLRDRVLRI